jgi:D-alanyl-D-alanine carboxypeptidase
MTRHHLVVASIALVVGTLAAPGSAAGLAASPAPASVATPASTITPLVSGFGELPTTPLDPTRSAALQAVIDDAVARGVPNVMAAVITPDGIWSGAAGVSGPDGHPVTADAEFGIASITKTFMSTLVMRLVEQGKMDLDAPLASYLGDLQADTNGATVRQALANRAGLPDSPSSVIERIALDPTHVWTDAEIVSTFDPPFIAAGATYQHSNPTWQLLGMAAEHVTGMSLASAMRAEVLDPVGAERILLQGPEAVTPRPWALPMSGHMADLDPALLGQGDALKFLADATYSAGAAGMASDAPSLASWAWHLFAGDIVDATSLGVMSDTRGGDGMGLYPIPDYPGQTTYGYDGGMRGYGSKLLASTNHPAVVVVLINDKEADFVSVAGRLLDIATSSPAAP